MADEEKKEQEQLDQEYEDALDFGGGGVEDSRGSQEDEPWDDDDKEAEEEQAKDEVAEEDEKEEKEEEDEDVATKGSEESIEEEEDEEGETTYTLDGKKYTAEEVIADPKLLGKMATHYNQVGNLSKLLDEERATVTAREEAIAQLEAENSKIEREWIAGKMAEEARRREAAEKEAPAPAPRPSSEVLKTQIKPYIDKLHKDGRLTEDEVEEHSGLIAEYVYDTATRDRTLQTVATELLRRIEQIEQFVNPAIKDWDAEKAARADVSIQAQAAKIEGYEELSDPENWEKLKKYISDKIAASPKDSEGRPTFDPIFDAETMAGQWDAMSGPTTRKALAALKKRAEKQKAEDAKKASGSATTGGKKPKKKPQKKGAPTEQEAALDWGDGRYAG
jgi:hypothetical protein